MHNGFDDLDLDRLRRRRSEKWRLHPPDVLPAFIAEMDYDLAEPVVAALRTALDLGDCGYAALPDIGETFAAFAAARIVPLRRRAVRRAGVAGRGDVGSG